jgi:hypothetical protein
VGDRGGEAMRQTIPLSLQEIFALFLHLIPMKNEFTLPSTSIKKWFFAYDHLPSATPFKNPRYVIA